MAHKRENDYFELLCRQVTHCTEAAGLLQAILANFAPDARQDQRASLHQVEHQADLVKHEMMEKLLHEFITPIEREDITALAQEIDNVTDNIEEVALRAYMYNISAVPPQAVRFGELVGRCCQALEEALEEFRHFRKSPTLYQKIVALNELEEEGDQLYTQAVRALYDQLEGCCDACEHVADIVETVVMKNS